MAVPSEHGGWGLTLEPVLLGLVVEPTIAGLCVGVAAMSAFLVRTPLKVVLVDAHRRRVLPRTRIAGLVVVAEGLVLTVLVVAAVELGSPFWVPVAVMAPLLAVELWHDMRSRGRRLLPELCGSIGIGGVAAMIVLVGGGDARLAAALWLVLAGRAVSAVVAVRDLVGGLHGRPRRPGALLVADVVAVSIVAVSVLLYGPAAAGAVSVGVAIGVQRGLAKLPTPRAVVLGIRQTLIGLAVVATTAAGVLLS